MAYAITNNSPSPGYVRWTDVNIQYKGVSYSITDGYTNYRYIYWLAATPTSFVVSDTFPLLGMDDLLVFLNKDGISMVVPTATILDGGLIVPGSIYASAIAANTITGGQIAAGTISAANIAAGTITTDKIAANTIGAGNIAAGAVIADKILAGAITADKIAVNAITATKILANSIETGHISAAGLSADVLKAGSVESTDGKTYFNLATSEIKESGSAQLILTLDKWTTGFGSLNTATGAEEASSYYLRTDFFSVKPSTAVVTSGTVYTQVKFFYTAAKTFISYSSAASATAPANAAYVRIRFYNAGAFSSAWEATLKGLLTVYSPITVTINPTAVFEIRVGDKKTFGVSANGRVYAQSLTNLDNVDYFASYGATPGGQVGLTMWEPNGASGVRPAGYLMIWDELGSFGVADANGGSSLYYEKSGTPGAYVEDFSVQSVSPISRGQLIAAHTETVTANNYTELNAGSVASTYSVGIDNAGAYVRHGETTKRRIKHQKNVCAGQCTLNSTSEVDVSFPRTMSGTPRIAITPNTATGGVISPKIRSVSTTGFSAIIGGSGFSGIVCDYIAIVD